MQIPDRCDTNKISHPLELHLQKLSQARTKHRAVQETVEVALLEGRTQITLMPQRGPGDMSTPSAARRVRGDRYCAGITGLTRPFGVLTDRASASLRPDGGVPANFAKRFGSSQ